MKHTRIYIAALLVLITICTVYALDVRKSAPITFTGSYSLVVSTSHPNPFKLNAVTMSFEGPRYNSLDIYLTRNGSTLPHLIYTSGTSTYTTVEWILDGRGINLTLGDTLLFTNIAVQSQAELIYDYEI